MKLIQITDTHLHADPLAHSRTGVPMAQLEAVVAAVIDERPDAVIVTGDISQDETPASYAAAARLFDTLPCPWYWLPGNHDRLDLMAAERELVDAVDLGAWRMLLLNTRVPGKPQGALGKEKLAALAAYLADDSRPALVAMHHPPVAVGADWMDAIGLEDRDAFWRTLSHYPQVQAVLFGHAHQAWARTVACAGHSVEVYGCPAAADQFLPRAVHFAVDAEASPGYRVMTLGEGELETRLERVAVAKASA
ncbi:metallophosphoesterase [Halomonas piscis]|uniref:metallophosphoesterase n=1 Tax=Halomonas piscis TaxID=3031727 RepID=UPI002896EED1|nr:metallophosphoesterase [Halomonas piscis]